MSPASQSSAVAPPTTSPRSGREATVEQTRPGSVRQSASLARITPQRCRTFEAPVLRCKDNDSLFGCLSSVIAPMNIFAVAARDSGMTIFLTCWNKKYFL
jgi:hypothetical protein